MPNSVMSLDIQPGKVYAELQLPLNELELAFGHQVNQHPENLVSRLSPELKSYLIVHIHPVSKDGKPWTVSVEDLFVQKIPASASGPYFELHAKVVMTPSEGETTREFDLNYDVIMHQVVTHFALISVQQDWEAGLYGEKPVELGVISFDIRSNKIFPFKVNLETGGIWNGFKQTVVLGMHHIAEGTDHLLFLLVLLLPAPLLVNRRRWGTFGGWRYSWIRLLKIVTAFTIGHSVTLIAGALGLFTFPSQLVEIVIAFSIIISAIHAFRPIFSGKEAVVAVGFGLIHGMAFAGTLVSLNLDIFHLGLSILGFNLGIELMQLFVIAAVFPWLIILSRSKFYSVIRISGAVFSALAASGWMVERITENSNFITVQTQRIVGHAPWLIALLAVAAVASLSTNFISKLHRKKEYPEVAEL
ncbi:HupE/UreJ family protein [Dyadobacter sp. UP-52]|uniref:HupE/UreJ family protein n=2 Tax=Dyadobacter subterraneus TaxID=2773304 RepID=A0ABR9WA60_9BACT|nr:HupE/UreJ family protein [Dyadobacter subterraneus]